MKQLLILVCTFAISTAAFAAPAKSAPKPMHAHFSGTVQKYDPGTHQLTIKHDGRDTVFQLNDKSQVMNGKSKADASSLGASLGQSVKIDYVMEGASRSVEKIDVSPAQMTKAPAKK